MAEDAATEYRRFVQREQSIKNVKDKIRRLDERAFGDIKDWVNGRYAKEGEDGN